MNGDGISDLVLVLRMTSPKNLMKVWNGGDKLDTNPRMLVVAFGHKDHLYSVVTANHELIPRNTNPNMEDPFHDIKIVKGKLSVSLGVFMDAGGWSMSDMSYTFRYQGDCLQLIGYDRTDMDRSSGEEKDVSINYLSMKKNTSTSKPDEEKPKAEWATVKSTALRCIDDIGDGIMFDSAK